MRKKLLVLVICFSLSTSIGYIFAFSLPTYEEDGVEEAPFSVYGVVVSVDAENSTIVIKNIDWYGGKYPEYVAMAATPKSRFMAAWDYTAEPDEIKHISFGEIAEGQVVQAAIYAKPDRFEILELVLGGVVLP